MAIPDYRVQPTSTSRFTMWETPAGSARALRAWFYPGDNFGQEFPYPNPLQQIAFAQTSSVTTTTTSRPPDAEPAPAPEEPRAFVQEPSREQAPAEIAQNSPPP